jgi:hypothetical protein
MKNSTMSFFIYGWDENTMGYEKISKIYRRVAAFRRRLAEAVVD